MALTCFACAFCGSRGGTVRLAALLPDAGAAVVQADHFPSERLLVFGVRRGRHVLGSVAWGGGTGSGEEGGRGKKKKKINKVGTQQTGTPQLELVGVTPPRVQHVAPRPHRWCIRAAAAPTPPASAAPAVASSAAPPAGRLWSRPPADAPSVTSCEVRRATADGGVFHDVIQ